MSAISWNPDYPAGTSTASEGDDAFRSLMTNFATGVGEFIYFPGSAASAGASTSSSGEPRLGTARTARVASVAGNVGNGFLGFETSKGGLWHLGSSWTYAPLGHPAMIEGAAVDAPATYRWVHAYGNRNITSSSGSGSIRATYVTAPSQLTFGAPPIIAWSVMSLASPSDDTQLFVGVLSDETGYTSVWSSLYGAVDTYLFWNSIGTVDY
jgi:hypothetical protein